uniref:Uncharacterized protein n=1 Tax=Candidatus Kentrum sp. LPFa TaxID=2126335 RepID=A0A450WAN0_9GAMM|nr:MAG: hypothetical protein BECKLPF1236B_GA0070989_105520 [Candidatus Kentron sp. LPFa]
MKKVLYILLIALAIVTVAIMPMMKGWLYTDIERIDRDFEGIFGGDASDKRAVASGGSSTMEKTIHLLVVHGIGRHCIGYADGLITGIARRANLSPAIDEASLYLPAEQCGEDVANYDFEIKQTKDCELIQRQGLSDRNCQRLKVEAAYTNPLSKGAGSSTFFPGYIRTQNYAEKGDANGAALRLYELTWDPATRWAKNFYVQAADDISNRSRAFLNRELKQRIINESISDAVLYLGQYRPMMQYPLLMSLCKIMSDAVGVADRDNQVFSCDLGKIADEFRSPGSLEAFFKKNEIVVMTHSLGTRMLFDTLGLMGHDDFLARLQDALAENEITIKIPESSLDQAVARQVRDVLSISINKVFTLANQVPLLELGRVTTPTSFAVDSDLGAGFNEFLKRRIDNDELPGHAVPPLQLVAFTDPNDLLSYNLKCWYYLRVLRYHDFVKAKAGKTNKEKRSFMDNYFETFARWHFQQFIVIRKNFPEKRTEKSGL